MATTVDYVVERVASLLQDTGHVRWTLPDLTNYLNEAQVAITRKVPPAYVTTESLTLVEGTKQTLPASGTLLQDIVRNYPGGSPGPVIRRVDMDIQNATDPDWHTATAAVTVESYLYEPADPYVFWVSPPQTSIPTDVQVAYASVPPIIDIGDNVSLGDEYTNAILEFMLHRAYSRDAEYAGPEGRSETHLAKFSRELRGR